MSTPPQTLEALAPLCDTWDFEAKLAAGEDKRGAVPESLWETYSATANTDCGVIVLGVPDLPDRAPNVPRPTRAQRPPP